MIRNWKIISLAIAVLTVNFLQACIQWPDLKIKLYNTREECEKDCPSVLHEELKCRYIGDGFICAAS